MRYDTIFQQVKTQNQETSTFDFTRRIQLPKKYELHVKNWSGARKNRSDLVDTFELLLDIGSLA